MIRIIACFLALCTVEFLAVPSCPLAQSRQAALRGQTGQGRGDKLQREQRDLEQKEREQQAVREQLIEKNRELLSQQAQVQRDIPPLEQELKKPLSADEYTKRKCELQDLQTKQDKVWQQVQQNQQDLASNQQNLTQTRQQLSQLQAVPSRVDRAPARPTPRRPRARQVPPPDPWSPEIWAAQQAQQAQQQADQQRAQAAYGRLTRMMQSPVNPLVGMPSLLTEQKPSGQSRPHSSQPSVETRTHTALETVPCPGIGTFLAIFDFDGFQPVLQADANSATLIQVTFTLTNAQQLLSFQFGLYNQSTNTSYFAGSPIFPGGIAADGTHTLTLTSGQFTSDVDHFVIQFTVNGSCTDFKIALMRVDFYK